MPQKEILGIKISRFLKTIFDEKNSYIKAGNILSSLGSSVILRTLSNI